MSIGAVRSRVVVVSSTQKDTKTASVAQCQGKQKWHVWNLAWREEMAVWKRPQHRAHDGASLKELLLGG